MPMAFMPIEERSGLRRDACIVRIEYGSRRSKVLKRHLSRQIPLIRRCVGIDRESSVAVVGSEQQRRMPVRVGPAWKIGPSQAKRLGVRLDRKQQSLKRQPASLRGCDLIPYPVLIAPLRGDSVKRVAREGVAVFRHENARQC